jgi:transcriptional regulator with XRE-family HTH domain
MARSRPQPTRGDLAGIAEAGLQSVGGRLRIERERQRIGLRELARRVDVSASLISQVELGRATPSVGTLYAIVSELGISLDELFFETPAAPVQAATDARGGQDELSARKTQVDSSHPPTDEADLIVRSSERKGIQLDSGVRWERLTSVTERDLDFLYVIYDVGGASCAANSLMRHTGREYGHVLKGRLGVTVGFDGHQLAPGDSISFDSTVPHRLFNAGDGPVEAIWFVVGRGGDARVSSLKEQ